MKEEIIKKLESALDEPIEKEKDVVYILAEIRKLLERDDKKSKYSVLNFYCNWVLHSVIDKVEPEIQKLLEEIKRDSHSSDHNRAILEKMLDSELLQKDLQKFVNDFSIGRNFEANWVAIKKLLIDIISDCPLKIKQGSVKEFNFTHLRDCEKIECTIVFKH